MMYGYARVSTPAQDLAAQLAELEIAGCEKIFSEKLSGAAAGRKRPELVKALAALQAGDVLVVVRLNRMARSTHDALSILAAVTAAGADFKSLREPWADTTTAAGRLITTIMVGLAEFDREMILERTGEGRANARARGVRLGRTPILTAPQVAFVVKSRAARPPIPISELRTLLGVSRSTICRAARMGEADLAAFPPAPAGAQVDLEELTGARPPGPIARSAVRST